MAQAPIVVGVDGSDCSQLAVDWAVDAAARHGRVLRLVYATQAERYERGASPSGEDRGDDAETGRELLVAARERAGVRRPGVPISAEVRDLTPVNALVREGREGTVLVVGSRGRGPLTTMFLGSVGLGVAARASCPVVVVRGERPALEGQFGRVVVGVSGARGEGAAIDFAFREADAWNVELRAVHAWPGVATEDAGQAEEAEARAVLARAVADASGRHPEVRTDLETVAGAPRSTLLWKAGSADLLVVGVRDRHGEDGLRLGLISHALVHTAPCPVAVVPRR
ncbi:universal stress protein [Streptomyces radicis]|uniref:universal stress protein n=1 Tax=Streptomyces radicis TaxID=1750517 RepID=UPI001600EA9F|nr:universal stress protein [Streptomyces radicis]